MNKAALCDEITGLPVNEPRRVSPEQKLALLQTNTEEGFLLLDAEFRIITFNHSFQKPWINFAKNIHEGDLILNKVPVHQSAFFESILVNALSGNEAGAEIELPFADQSIHTYFARYKPAFNKDRMIVGVFISLTEKKKESNTNNLKALINNTNDLMWSIDRDHTVIASNKAFDEIIKKVRINGIKSKSNIPEIELTEDKQARWDGFYINEKTVILESITDGFVTINKNWEVTYWNKEAERIMGIARENITGKNIWEVFPSAVGLKFYSETHKAISNQHPLNFEEFFPPLSMWIHVSAYPSEEGLSVYFKDITEKKLADEKIRIAKQRYEMFARATNDAIYEWDIISDAINWNEGYETLFGHKRTGDKMPASSWLDNLHIAEKEKLFTIVFDAFKNKITSLTRELQFRCADGSFKIVFDKLVIRYDVNGEPTAIFGSMQDITERRQNEMAIRKLNDQLEKRAAELIASNAELERFAYIASHDLQEPLRMVSSFLQLLEKKHKSSLDEAAHQYIAYAVDGAGRMKKLILDLLEYSRVGTNKEELIDTDMNAVMTQVLETFSCRIHETGAIFNMQTFPLIKASKMQMTQLLQNLVSNSLKYTASVPEIEIGYEDKGDCWQFFVKDNGIGIEEKFFDKVFIIFQRLHNKNQFSGTGIGLAICKKIVEKHGGTTWIKSVIGEGTSFFFTIKK